MSYSTERRKNRVTTNPNPGDATRSTPGSSNRSQRVKEEMGVQYHPSPFQSRETTTSRTSALNVSSLASTYESNSPIIETSGKEADSLRKVRAAIEKKLEQNRRTRSQLQKLGDAFRDPTKGKTEKDNIIAKRSALMGEYGKNAQAIKKMKDERGS